MVNLFSRHEAFEEELEDAGPPLPTEPPMSLPPFPLRPPPTPTVRYSSTDESQSPPSTLQTSTSSKDAHSYPTYQSSTTAPTVIASEYGPVPTPTGFDDDPDGSEDWPGKKPSHGVMKAAAGVVPAVMFALIAIVVFFYLRRRKRRRAQQASSRARAQEMKTRNAPIVAAHYTSAQPSPPLPAQTLYAAPPSHPPPPASPPPVILGPIGGGSNGAYFTGIDTSDVVSMHDRNGLGNPFADGDSLNEEPPPPYRPRSIAPSSRNSSIRVPDSTHSRTNLIPTHNQPTRSPFVDPDGEDTMSDISEPPTRRNQDTFSAVSDLSYQQDPVFTRPSV